MSGEGKGLFIPSWKQFKVKLSPSKADLHFQMNDYSVCRGRRAGCPVVEGNYPLFARALLRDSARGVSPPSPQRNGLPYIEWQRGINAPGETPPKKKMSRASAFVETENRFTKSEKFILVVVVVEW